MEIKIDTDEMNEVGDNLSAVKVGNYLILVTDTTVDIGPSKSGKMDGIASTGGFARLSSGINGNVYIGKPA